MFPDAPTHHSVAIWGAWNSIQTRPVMCSWNRSTSLSSCFRRCRKKTCCSGLPERICENNRCQSTKKLTAVRCVRSGRVVICLTCRFCHFLSDHFKVISLIQDIRNDLIDESTWFDSVLTTHPPLAIKSPLLNINDPNLRS